MGDMQHSCLTRLPTCKLSISPGLRYFLSHINCEIVDVPPPVKSQTLKCFQHFGSVDTVKSLLSIYEAQTHSFWKLSAVSDIILINPIASLLPLAIRCWQAAYLSLNISSTNRSIDLSVSRSNNAICTELAN